MGTMTRASPGRRIQDAYRRHRTDLLLAAVVALLVAPILQPLMDQQQSRYALTAAIHDHRTVVLDRYDLGVDRAERDGRLYSDKAPGQAVLALPAYAVYRALGGVPAEDDQPLGNLGLWSVSLWTAALPTVGCALLMRRLARRVSPGHATVAALATVTGTILLPFGTQLFSHALTAFLCLAAYLLLLREERTALAAAGGLMGMAVASEYSVGLAAVALTAVAVVRHRARAAWFVLGGLPFAAALAAYHWVVFGGPLRLPYHYARIHAADVGLVGARLPRPDMLARVLLGERGLLLLTPIVLAGVVGAVLVARGRGDRRLHGVVALVMFALFVGLQGGWANPTGGWSPGARYAVPALPFLVVGVARAWERWPRALVAAALIGTAAMLLATLTLPLAPRGETAVLWWLERVRDGRTARTLVTWHLGPPGLLLPPAVAAVVAWRLLRADEDAPAAAPTVR
jgi:hypothetical protein